MKEEFHIVASKRSTLGTGGSRYLRQQKKIPGIIYGEKKDPLPVELDEKLLKIKIQDPSFFSKQCEIKYENELIKVLPKDMQVHPVKESILHIDFLRVGDNTTVSLFVPVKFTNENKCPGIKQGGVLNIVRHEVELKTLVSKIPAFLEANLDGLEIGDSIHISSISLEDGVKPTIDDRDFTIATIAPPTVMKVEEDKAPDEDGDTEGAGDASTEETKESKAEEQKTEASDDKKES